MNCNHNDNYNDILVSSYNHIDHDYNAINLYLRQSNIYGIYLWVFQTLSPFTNTG